MSMGKWIGGFLGLMAGGPLGAIAGYVLGSIFDSSSSDNDMSATSSGDGQQSQQQYYEGQRNTFRFSLLVLASYIIRADGKVMHSEMNVVRAFLRQTFGEQAVTEGEQIMLKLSTSRSALAWPSFARRCSARAVSSTNTWPMSSALSLSTSSCS